MRTLLFTDQYLICKKWGKTLFPIWSNGFQAGKDTIETLKQVQKLLANKNDSLLTFRKMGGPLRSIRRSVASQSVVVKHLTLLKPNIFTYVGKEEPIVILSGLNLP